MAKKLEEIKEEECPYELPEGWKWEYIGSCFDVTSSKRVRKDDWLDKGIPFYRTRELVKLSKDGFVDNELFISEELYNDFLNKYDVPKVNDILISGVGTIGIPYIVNSEDKFYFKDGNVIWFKNKNVVISKYIFYLYYSDFIINQIHELSSGSTVDTYTIINAKKTIFPLPPKETQQKIVDIIESLFAKLDIAQEKVEQVLAESENRRSAILHNAFSGKLTEKWRKENGVSFDSWRKNKIKEVSTPRAGYAFDSKKFCNNGYQVIRMGNLYGGELLLDRSPVYYDENDVDEKILNRALLRDKDIVITLTGTKYKRDYGYAVCLYEPYKLLLNQRCMSLTANEKIIEYRYLLYYLRSNQFRDIFFSNETGGVNQGNVSSKFVENIEITLPLQPEQKEIIRLLDKFLSVEDKVKSTCQNTLESIATMRKSILAKAFRGELCS